MNERKFNLKKRKANRKDFSSHKTLHLGAGLIQDELLFLSPVLNQGSNNECTAYSASAIRASMKSKVYDPEAQWQFEKQLGAADDGTDLKTQLATGVKIGFEVLGTNEAIDQASAYFWVTKNGGMDWFDSVRTAIQQIQAPLSAGVLWMNEWDNPLNGIIPDLGKKALGGHCVKIAGWKIINGQPYMVIQNSWGTGYGDSGLFYFPRAVFNRVFGDYGIGYWSDDPSLRIKKLGLLSALLQNLVNLYNQLISRKNGTYPPPQPVPTPAPAKPTYEWSSPTAARHSVRVICDEEGLLGLTLDGHPMKDVLTGCVAVESGFNPKAVHYNKNGQGKVLSTDFGIVQVNDYWHIGPNREFPSVDYVMNNPEQCVRWMAKMFKLGKQSMWVSFSLGLYKPYL